MAFAQYPIPNIEQTITKPIIVQVLEKLKQDVFYDRSTAMLYIDHTTTTHEIGSTISGKNSNELSLETSSKVVVTSSEQILNDIVMSSVVNSNELDTVWSDPKIGMYLKPTRPRTEILLQLNYTASSKSEVNNWVNQYYNRLARGLVYTNTDVGYEYTIPDECIAIIHEVWSTMEGSYPYDRKLIPYIQEHSNTSFDFKTNIAGKGASMVMRELLTNIAISVTNEVPEPSRTEAGAYEATIEVSFKYDKPTVMHHKYPIFVHSNYINSKYFDVTRNRNAENKVVPRTTTGLMNNLLSLYSRTSEDVYSKDGIVYPSFDDMLLSYGTLDLAPVLQVQLGISESDRTLLMGLNNLSIDTGIELHPEILKYIKDSGQGVFNYGQSSVCISIFKNGVRLNPAKYYLTNDMEIRSNYDLDLRGNYHLGISLLTKLELLNRPAVGTLAKYGDFAASTIKAIHPTIPDEELPAPDNPDAIPGIDSTEVNINTLYNTLEKLPYKLKYSSSSWLLVNTIAVYSH